MQSANHKPSANDLEFVDEFESGSIAPQNFGHREHLRMAYTLLAMLPTQEAQSRVRRSLKRFIRQNGIPLSKYSETLTKAWLLAVHHFMKNSTATRSCDEFLELNPLLLDPEIMLSHYSKSRLFSESAKSRFIEPDLEPIPRYA